MRNDLMCLLILRLLKDFFISDSGVSCRLETKSLTIFIQKLDDNVPDEVESSEIRKWALFPRNSSGALLFPGRNRKNRRRQRETDRSMKTLREIFSLSSSVSFHLRGEFVEMRRTMKDARRIITLCFQQKLRISLSFHFSQSYQFHWDTLPFLFYSRSLLRYHWHEGINFISHWLNAIIVCNQ